MTSAPIYFPRAARLPRHLRRHLRRNLTRHLTLVALLQAGAASAQGMTMTDTEPAPAPAPAIDAAGVQRLRDTTLALIEALVQQGLLTRERADALLKQPAPSSAVGAGTFGTPAAAEPVRPVQRVVLVPQRLRDELRESIKLDVLSQAREEGWADARQIPEWSRRIRLSGDVRVRAQSELFDSGNWAADDFQSQSSNGASPAWSPDLTNTTHDRHRLTLRARLGVEAKVGTDTSAGLRLSTGASGSGATSSSQTLGSGFNKASVTLDRAWIQWEPRHDLRLQAGRIANPYFGTDLLWPDDLSLDGVAVSADHTLASGLYAYATAGLFALEENALSPHDKWLAGLQGGLDWTPSDRHQWRLGVALYDFNGVAGVRESSPAPSGSAATTTPYFVTEYAKSQRLKGNTLIRLNDPTSTGTAVWGLASRFRPVNLTVAHVWKPWSQPLAPQLTTSLDWVKNLGFDLDDIARRAGDERVRDVVARTSGLQLRAQYGQARLTETGQWQVHMALRRFERDAWLDGLTDTAWNGGGGTNYRGWSLGGQYALDGATTLGLRWVSTRNLDDRVVSNTFPEGTLSGAPFKVDQLQIDLSTRF